VLLPAQLAGTSSRIARRRCDELLESLGIAHRGQAYPGRLSGGERQRVAIARALINRPALLLADEPTGAVDGQTGQRVAEILRELAQDGQTLMIVTHDLALARYCAPRAVTLVDGRVGPSVSAAETSFVAGERRPEAASTSFAAGERRPEAAETSFAVGGGAA
jgi:putative ABC transport system ATP-binding protein